MHTQIVFPYSEYLAEQLYSASYYGHDQAVLELLQRGAPPNSDYYTVEKRRHTPLHMACAQNHLRSTELLIKFGAFVAATSIRGWTPLHSACYNNNKTIAKLLMKHHCPTGEPYMQGVSITAVSVSRYI